MAFFSVTDEARRGKIIDAIKFPIVKNIKSSRFIDSVKSTFYDKKQKLPRYNLKISPENLRLIQLQVQELLKVGADKAVLTDDKKMWVKAIFQADKDYSVKVRIRGDLSNHWAYAKKSWRVKFDKDDLFKSYKQLDFIIPRDKGYTTEAAGDIVAKKNGLLVPDSWFAGVSINGIDMGGYLVMEKNSSQMLENKGYFAGEIFALGNIWVETSATHYGLPSKVTFEYFPGAFKETINEDQSPIYKKGAFTYFLDLINKSSREEFRKKIPIVLDMERYLRWNSITWLFGTTHPHWGDNLRWYYDSTRGKFEPILYDTKPRRLVRDNTGSFETIETDMLAKRIISENIEWRQRRNEILWDLTNDPSMFVDRISRDLFNQLKDYLFKGVGSEYNFNALEEFNKLESYLKYNRQRIKGFLNFARLFVQPEFKSDSCILQVMPDSLSKIKINSIRITSKKNIKKSGKIMLYLLTPEGKRIEPEYRIGKKDNALFIEFKDLQIFSRLEEDLSPMKTIYQIVIIDNENGFIKPEELSFKINATNTLNDQIIDKSYIYIGSNSSNNHKEIDSFTDDIDISLNRKDINLKLKDDVLIIKKGSYEVKENLIIPSGYDLLIEKGVKLNLYPDVNIIVYGALNIKGTKEEPVEIKAKYSDRPFGTVASINSRKDSEVSYLNISGGNETNYGGIFFSGQFCYYWSDVKISNSKFLHANADDSLNIKNSDVNVSYCLFKDNSSDAFDGDFITGNVENCDLISNNGDGVDVSGSRIKVVSCKFDNTKDKGISVGENTNMFIFNCRFTENQIGVASKDLSNTTILYSEFEENEKALSVYQKKEIFGPSRIDVYTSVFSKNTKDFDVQTGSEINVESSLTGTKKKKGLNLKNTSDKNKDVLRNIDNKKISEILSKRTGMIINIRSKPLGNIFKPGRK
ncbi:MAG: hypothetical protein C0601_05590 [Candidatus Muiribacterium halophilum]|uniref:Right handed beta helix domain-containing protein n=1 Tax=Muiribacterium halophilum TaxID=2053465 RepID=A0A2N5ZHL3_MUIH1|nr:MAG: hypothetical protein C0601_05590 [Candidatus Muirbacterium halophilum]